MKNYTNCNCSQAQYLREALEDALECLNKLEVRLARNLIEEALYQNSLDDADIHGVTVRMRQEEDV